MFEMYLNGNLKYQWINDIDNVKNRDDKTILTIYSMHPERFLVPEIAHPDQVKHLTIYLPFCEFDSDYYAYEKTLENDCNCNSLTICKKCTWYGKIDDNTLCSDIINFQNLETLTVENMNLSSVLWLKFIENSQNLKEINFSYIGCEHDDFWFEKDERVLDALFKIPTLEKMTIKGLQLYYFPPGPSNIKHLELNAVLAEDEDLRKIHCDSYKNNFSTHTNIKSLVLAHRRPTPYRIEDLKLDKITQLEDITLKNWGPQYFESMLLLPNLKKFKFIIMFDEENDPLMKELIKNPNLIFPSVEDVTIEIINFLKFDFTETRNYLTEVLNKQCVNLKKFTFKIPSLMFV
jgi:hypothetical protein